MTRKTDTIAIEAGIRKTRQKIREDIEALEDHLHADERALTHHYLPGILGGAVVAAGLVALGGSKALKIVVLVTGALGIAAVYSRRH